jgi:dihydrofolate reductase
MSPVPRISIIAAVARNQVIGSGNRMPWRLPEDLKRFRRLTLGHAVVMGRRTFDSIGKPLPGRDNIVVTRSREWSHPGCRAEIYRLALPRAARLYLTEIERDFDGDAFFPDFDRSIWREVSRESRVLDGPEGFAYHFAVYEPRA